MNAGESSSSLAVPKALAVLAVALVLTIFITIAISPSIVNVLHVVGATDVGVDKVTIRTLELIAIAVTVVALLCMGGGGKAAWGIPPTHGLVRRVMLGFMFGLVSLGVVCVVLFVFEVRVVRHDLSMEPAYWLRVFAGAMVSAVVVGVLEEVWFRGGLFTLLRRSGGVTLALLGGSVLYAAVHFLTIPGGLDAGESQQWTSLQVLYAAAQNMFQLRHLDSFVALFIAGVTLGLLRLRQGDVAVCIGVHAGWVLTIKVFKKLTYVSPTGANRFLAGQYDDVIGWVAAACLAVMLILVWRFVRPGEQV